MSEQPQTAREWAADLATHMVRTVERLGEPGECAQVWWNPTTGMWHARTTCSSLYLGDGDDPWAALDDIHDIRVEYDEGGG